MVLSLVELMWKLIREKLQVQNGEWLSNAITDSREKFGTIYWVVSCEEENSLELQEVAISYKQKFPNQLH